MVKRLCRYKNFGKDNLRSFDDIWDIPSSAPLSMGEIEELIARAREIHFNTASPSIDRILNLFAIAKFGFIN